MLLIFLVIFQKCVPAWAFHVPPPPRARLYIVETEPKIVYLTAGAEKNSRKEVKRVKTSIFFILFRYLKKIRKICRRAMSQLPTKSLPLGLRALLVANERAAVPCGCASEPVNAAAAVRFVQLN